MSGNLKNRLLVTGASGFLGSEIVRQCEQDQQPVRSLGRRELARPNYHALDLAADPIPDDLFRDIDTVIHSAGLAHQFGKSADDRGRFFAVNADATEKIIRASAANGVRHFVLISSSGVYGPSQKPRDENSPCDPQGHYGESKFEGENKARAVAKETGISLTIIRMTTLYGEGDRGNMNRLIRTIDSGKFVQIGNCTNRKNFIHKSDAARACRIIAESTPTEPTTYNVGLPSVAISEVMDGIVSALQCKPPIRIPSFIASSIAGIATAVCLGKGPFARVKVSIQKWLSNDEFRTEKFQTEFNFTQLVSLQEGLARQVAAYQAEEKTSGSIPTASFAKRIVKRFFDIVLCLFMLVLFAIPMLVIAALVKLTSKGPALYWSDRVGKDNKLFPMAKFRSMRTDTPEVATHLLGDSKSWITPLGRVLRKTSLDEFPQLLNILMGHMSFVGPRPALYNQKDLIELRTALGVHTVRPGITGLAQVSGRDELLICEKVEFDRQYLGRQGLFFDIGLIIKTALAVVLKKGVKQADEDSSVDYVVLQDGNGDCVMATPETVSAVAVAFSNQSQTRLICVRTEQTLTESTLKAAIGNAKNALAFVRSGEFEQAKFSDDADDAIAKLSDFSVALSVLPATQSDDLGQQLALDVQFINDAKANSFGSKQQPAKHAIASTQRLTSTS